MEKELITMHLGINILDNGLKIRKMEMVYCNTRMEQYMTDNGQMISLPTKDKSYTPTKINIKAHF